MSRQELEWQRLHSIKEKVLTISIRLDLRKRLVKTLVWPVVLHECQTWPMRNEELNRLNAFEMWLWSRGDEWERLAGWTKGQMNKYSASRSSREAEQKRYGTERKIELDML